jgi:hypothetical protein
MAASAKVHPCDNIDVDDPHLLPARPNEPPSITILLPELHSP